MDVKRTISLGRFIAGRRKQMRMTQEELAELMNVSKSAIAKWETDGGIPDRDNLMYLAKVLGTSVENLYRLTDTEAYDADNKPNITADVIAVLEAYGYTIIPPSITEEKEIEEDTNESL